MVVAACEDGQAAFDRAVGRPGVMQEVVEGVLLQRGVVIGWLLGGVAVIEMVFSWPGLGNMAVYAITMRDYPLIEGFVLWVALAYMCINALVDASYILLDPRLKRERA